MPCDLFTLPDMTDYLTVDDGKPTIFFLLHLPECCCDLLKLGLGGVVAIKNPLFVVAFDRSICP